MSSRTVYQLLLYLFRSRPGEQPVIPPFLQNRPLTEAEFLGAQELYVTQRIRRQPKSAGTTQRRDISKTFPFFDSAEKVGDWKAHILIGRAMFASRPEQAKQRNLLRAESMKGPRSRRTFLASARRALPNAKNRFSGDELLKVAQHLRGREFVWAFLWCEARAVAAAQGSHAIACALAQASTLASSYPYLGMTANQIRAGLQNREDQPERDTAARFSISAKSVKSLISRSRD